MSTWDLFGCIGPDQQFGMCFLSSWQNFGSWTVRVYTMHGRVPVPLCGYEDSRDRVSVWDILQQRTVRVHTVCTGVVFGQCSSYLYSLHRLRSR